MVELHEKLQAVHVAPVPSGSRSTDSRPNRKSSDANEGVQANEEYVGFEGVLLRTPERMAHQPKGNYVCTPLFSLDMHPFGTVVLSVSCTRNRCSQRACVSSSNKPNHAKNPAHIPRPHKPAHANHPAPDLCAGPGEAPDTLFSAGRVLFRDLSFLIRKSHNVIIMGPCGCGMSCVLRVLAQLWEPERGRVVCSPNARLFFGPQCSYTTTGTLREQLMYAPPRHDLIWP